MKSAYELAMERLEKQSPTARLTEEQRTAIAEIESTYKAKIAERELFLQAQMQKAVAARNVAEAEEIRLQLTREIRRLQEECEEKKAKAR